MIIGLSGYAQSGKDTVANILVENYGYTRIAFADKIRELLYEMSPMVGAVNLNDIVSEYGWDVAKQNPEVRAMLQNLGVGARKIFGPQFWVNEAMKIMLNDPRPDMNYVITDVRFLNEADMVRANHGYLWRVVRPGVEPVNSHVSENNLDGYSFNAEINNSGTLEGLNIQVATFYNGFKHRDRWNYVR
jgi:hypothetical protein